MNEGKINLTQAEANDLIKLLDIAQKTLGLQGSEICIHFVKKINDAFKIDELPDSPPVTDEPSSPAIVDIKDLETKN